MENKKINSSISIIGSGPIGLMISLMLSKAGIKVNLIDQKKFEIFKSNNDHRTTAISQGTKKIFEDLNLWEILSSKSEKIKDIKVQDFINRSDLDFNSSKLKYGPLGYIIENYFFHNTLKNAVLKNSMINIFDSSKVMDIVFYDNFAELITKKKKITSNLIIGADGRNSKTRSFAHLKNFQYDYNQTAYIFNIRHEKDHKGIALERFFSEGPLAVLPMQRRSNKFMSSIVWTIDNKLGDFTKLDKKSFKEEFLARYLNFFGKVLSLSKPISYPLNLKYAFKNYRKNFVLIGDASQAIHPIAGQGFNLGARDCKILSEIIIKSKLSGLDLGSETILSDFSNKRYLDKNLFISSTHYLNKFFSNNTSFARIIRKTGLSILNNSDFFKNRLMTTAMGLNI